MKSKFWFWLTFGVAFVLAVYVSARIVLSGGDYSVKKISIYVNDCPNTSECVNGIAANLHIIPGQSVNLQTILSDVLANPDVASASVQKRPNGEIKIRVNMRVVVATWTDGTYYYPMDSSGEKINRPTNQRPINSLVFSGNVPDDFIRIENALKKTPHLRAQINYLEFIENRRWDIYLTSGMKIMLPEGDPTDTLNQIEKMNSQNMILSRKIKLLDMRDPSRPLVKLEK
ncbi:MAG: cell division protein FtsQ/DivIB [Rickettsiales bacterium]|jgi:cell division protein FtsQ|nr:cell division protein FtsQ/DivIB [Rickettsiales bacterium]